MVDDDEQVRTYMTTNGSPLCVYLGIGGRLLSGSVRNPKLKIFLRKKKKRVIINTDIFGLYKYKNFVYIYIGL